MSAEIIEVDTMEDDGDIRRIKVAVEFKEAYIDRYKRLGYREQSVKTENTDGKSYAVIIMKRDASHPKYRELKEIEQQVKELLSAADSAENRDEKTTKKRKLTLNIMLWAGVAVALCGVGLLVGGFLNSSLALALSGWGVIIVGAAAVIVWSFLRESWRLRKKDIADDAEYPGFGVDKVSREIEKKLTQADILCGNNSHSARGGGHSARDRA